MSRLTKQDIIDRAIQLFGTKGVDATSIQDIADVCGIRKPSLYSHFSGRDAIVTAAYTYALGVYHSALTFLSTEKYALHSIHEMIDRIIDLHDRDTGMFRFLVMNQYSQIALPGVVAEQNIIQTLSNVIRAGQEDGSIVHAPHSDVLALSISGILIQQSVGIMFGRLVSEMGHYRQDIHVMCDRILSAF